MCYHFMCLSLYTHHSLCDSHPPFFLFDQQELALQEIKKELLERPTEKLVDDLRKKVKILQVIYSTLTN